MRVGDAFPSKFIKTSDLRGHAVEVIIDRYEIVDVSMESEPEEFKPVLFFVDKKKGLVLNKTNASTIADTYGEEMDGWKLKTVELYPDKTTFKGDLVDCLRVRVPGREIPPPASADDDIPF